jgi:hypothetical protein
MSGRLEAGSVDLVPLNISAKRRTSAGEPVATALTLSTRGGVALDDPGHAVHTTLLGCGRQSGGKVHRLIKHGCSDCDLLSHIAEDRELRPGGDQGISDAIGPNSRALAIPRSSPMIRSRAKMRSARANLPKPNATMRDSDIT